MVMKDKTKDLFASKLLAEIGEMPALTAAYKAQDCSAKVGFDFDNISLVFEKVRQEYGEMAEAFEAKSEDFKHFEEELGDCLFALVNLARWMELDPEQLLKDNVKKYLNRCHYIESELRHEDKNWRDLTKSEIYSKWKAAKITGL